MANASVFSETPAPYIPDVEVVAPRHTSHDSSSDAYGHFSSTSGSEAAHSRGPSVLLSPGGKCTLSVSAGSGLSSLATSMRSVASSGGALPQRPATATARATLPCVRRAPPTPIACGPLAHQRPAQQQPPQYHQQRRYSYNPYQVYDPIASATQLPPSLHDQRHSIQSLYSHAMPPASRSMNTPPHGLGSSFGGWLATAATPDSFRPSPMPTPSVMAASMDFECSAGHLAVSCAGTPMPAPTPLSLAMGARGTPMGRLPASQPASPPCLACCDGAMGEFADLAPPAMPVPMAPLAHARAAALTPPQKTGMLATTSNGVAAKSTNFVPPPPPPSRLFHELDDDIEPVAVAATVAAGARWANRVERWLEAHPKHRPFAPQPLQRDYPSPLVWLDKLSAWYYANFIGRKVRGRRSGNNHASP